MNFETLKADLKWKLKTLSLKHVVLFVLLAFVVLELAIPAVSAWWGGGWGGGWWGRPWWGGGWWRPWWGGGWGGGWWRPWWGGGWGGW